MLLVIRSRIQRILEIVLKYPVMTDKLKARRVDFSGQVPRCPCMGIST